MWQNIHFAWNCSVEKCLKQEVLLAQASVSVIPVEYDPCQHHKRSNEKTSENKSTGIRFLSQTGTSVRAILPLYLLNTCKNMMCTWRFFFTFMTHLSEVQSQMGKRCDLLDRCRVSLACRNGPTVTTWLAVSSALSRLRLREASVTQPSAHLEFGLSASHRITEQLMYTCPEKAHTWVSLWIQQGFQPVESVLSYPADAPVYIAISRPYTHH